jgi:chemotaxis protein MotB
MAGRTRRHNGQGGLDAWPGYVDALSTLLLVIIFVLLVFVLAQAFLSVALSGRDKALDKVNAQLAQLTDALSLERSHGNELQLSISQLNKQLSGVTTARDTLTQQLAALQDQAQRVTADRDTLRTQRDTLTRQLSDANLLAQSQAEANKKLQSQLADVTSQATAATQQNAQLTSQMDTAQKQLSESQQQLADVSSQAKAAGQQNTQLTSQLGATQKQLADAQQQLADAQQRLKDMKLQMAELDKTVTADKETIQAKLSDLAKLTEQARALAALRDQLEQQAQDAAARAMTEQQRRAAVAAQLAEEKKLGDSAKAQIALLNQQVEQLKEQLASVSKALDLTEQSGRDKDTQIVNLGQKLNAALAAKVEELQLYRSDFFGQLRKVLANRQGITVVGDRFVFQSDVLFPVGSAELTQAGVAQLTSLAVQIKDLIPDLPNDVKWVLQVEGHTDPQPVKGGQFNSNWELSAARAISVVKLLIQDGIPAEHLSAAGFAQYQPIAEGSTPDDYAKDRRIELRLTNG